MTIRSGPSAHSSLKPAQNDPLGQVERGDPWQDADDCEPLSPRSEEPRILTGAFTELQGVEVVRGDLTLMLTSGSPASLPDLKQVHGKLTFAPSRRPSADGIL